MVDDTESKSLPEYKITETKPDKSDKDSPETPQYSQKISLDDDQKMRLVDEVISEFKNIKEERDVLGLEGMWDAQANQYDGIMEENQDAQFNIHIHTSKIKVDSIVRAAKRAFLDVDPKFAVSPRPEFWKKNQQNADQICEDQQEFLDYKISEELGVEQPLELALYSSAKHYVGIMKFPWTFKQEKKRRDETYRGVKVLAIDPQTGTPIVNRDGLDSFLKNYPDAEKTNKDILNKLMRGEDVTIQVEYKDVTYNNPEPQFVENKSFYVYNYVNGLKGLKVSRLTVEKLKMSWHDLLERESGEGWENIDDLKFKGSRRDKLNANPVKHDDYSTKDYTILEVNYYFNEKNSNKIEDETKVKCWIAEEREILLHVIEYPYYGLNTEYIPFYIKRSDDTFWGGARSVMQDLAPTNLAENMFVNFMLEGTWSNLTQTPVVKEGSTTEQQLMNKRWTHGVPLVVRRDASDVSKELTFLPKTPFNPGEVISVLQYLIKQDDDVTGVSSLMTGRESPTDPRAPATKTLALLKASGLNIEDYIRTLLPSFNEIANVLLQLYYQMSEDSVAFKTRATLQKVTGGNPFKDMKREDMVAKTNIQSMAYAFNTDKVQEKQDMLALYQVLRPELVARGDVKSLDHLCRSIVKAWNPMMRTRVDMVWPTLEDFQKQMEQDMTAGIAKYIQTLQMVEKTTGVPQAPNAQKAMQLATQLNQQKMGVPPPEKTPTEQAVDNAMSAGEPS